MNIEEFLDNVAKNMDPVKQFTEILTQLIGFWEKNITEIFRVLNDIKEKVDRIGKI